MKVELWPISRPVPYARNARRISEEAIVKLCASIKEFGWRVPIVVDDEDVILAGHTRLEAAKRLGLESVPVHIATGLTKAQRKAFRLADNRTNLETRFDYELVALELSELKDDFDYDLLLTAFDQREIDPLLALDNSDQGTAPEDFKEITEDNLKTDSECPKCGFKYASSTSGKKKVA